MSRKIVALTSEEENWVVAACDDGTVWSINLGFTDEFKWDQLPSIPEEEDKEVQ